MKMKRFLAMLLCLVMVVGLVPATVFATEVSAPIDTAIFFSDLHTTSNNYKESILKGVMSAVKGLPVSSVTSCGDAFSVNSGLTEVEIYSSHVLNDLLTVSSAYGIFDKL